MNELIPVRYDDDNPAVSARDLHSFLGIGTEFRHWFPRMCEYGFVEGIDYTPVIFDHPQNGQPTTDYIMRIECAKEISMLQRNEKGKQARQYFIQLEKAWNTPEAVMSRALKLANRTLDEIKAANLQLESKIESDRPKVLFADSVSGSQTSILIRDMAKLLCQNGYSTGEKRLYATLREQGFLIKKPGRDYNSPSQKSMHMGLMELKETTIIRSSGSQIRKTPLITGRGQQYFIKRFLREELKI